MEPVRSKENPTSTPFLDMIRALPVPLQRKTVHNLRDVPTHKLSRRKERDSEKSYLDSSSEKSLSGTINSEYQSKKQMQEKATSYKVSAVELTLD